MYKHLGPGHWGSINVQIPWSRDTGVLAGPITELSLDTELISLLKVIFSSLMARHTEQEVNAVIRQLRQLLHTQCKGMVRQERPHHYQNSIANM